MDDREEREDREELESDDREDEETDDWLDAEEDDTEDTEEDDEEDSGNAPFLDRTFEVEDRSNERGIIIAHVVSPDAKQIFAQLVARLFFMRN